MNKENIDSEEQEIKANHPIRKNLWVKEGLIWGLFMYVCMTFLFPLIFSEEITLKKVLLSIPLWTLAGLSYGYLSRKFWRKIKKK